MKLNDYQKHAQRTHNEDLPQAQAFANYALGLSGESGEVADHIKKGIFHGHEMNRHELAKELGDCLWYIANLSKLAGFTLEDVAEMNVNKLKARYPDGFDKEKSVNRID